GGLAQRAERRPIRCHGQAAREEQRRDVAERHERRQRLRAGVHVRPWLEEARERCTKAGVAADILRCHCASEHRYLLRSFIETPLTTATAMDASATVRCSRRLSKSVSASFDSF